MEPVTLQELSLILTDKDKREEIRISKLTKEQRAKEESDFQEAIKDLNQRLIDSAYNYKDYLIVYKFNENQFRKKPIESNPCSILNEDIISTAKMVYDYLKELKYKPTIESSHDNIKSWYQIKVSWEKKVQRATRNIHDIAP
mgnify:CR=1 FL=1|tara:strand:- start:16719 stop:17144 length:426 start_codon:yes stop_codon:yes gene_type:complete